MRAPGHVEHREAAVRLALVGVAAWCGALLVGPLLRPDLDILRTHPETYALGAWGTLMRLGYAGMAVADWSAAFLAGRYRVAAVLLAVFGAGAMGIGLFPPTDTGSPADQVFPCLQFAPLAFFPAIAWISWRTRRRPLLVLAALAWLLFLPLVFGEPAVGGLLNGAADLAMGAWIGTFAWTERTATP